ncbi:phage tail protein [Hymenobacter sediminicola]|uniref:Phage tail protein n=1 Tax=Hymenobacter sediminicola TaxID=2761579 RepID=A0A7G7W9N8_9BACT|nr:tail fiber protein [Hymenobacter sediminicola]QNH63081.1 phage tail protein [Hymenobacter sediminicola]
MDPFVGEIRLMALNFAPVGWALCQGQILPIQQNTALFSLLGTTYGGNGQNTFGLPDLRGRTYAGVGQGEGLSPYPQGAVLGTETETLLLPQLPMHVHTLAPSTMPVNNGTADQQKVSNAYYATPPAGQPAQYALDGGVNMAADLLSGTAGPAGNGKAHENRMPFLVLNYCIALQGVFPQRP